MARCVLVKVNRMRGPSSKASSDDTHPDYALCRYPPDSHDRAKPGRMARPVA